MLINMICQSFCTALTAPRPTKGRASMVLICRCGYLFHPRFVSMFFLAVTGRPERAVVCIREESKSYGSHDPKICVKLVPAYAM